LFNFVSGGIVSSGIGVANVSFDLNDSVTSFKVWADAITDDGHLASESKLFSSLNPFFIEYKLPIEVSSGDEIGIPVSFVNSTENNISVELKKKSNDEGKFLEFPQEEKTSNELKKLMIPEITVNSMDRKRTTISAKAAKKLIIGAEVRLTLEAIAGPLRDTVIRSTRVLPSGFPYVATGSGTLSSKESTLVHEIDLPSIFDADTISTTFKIYLSPLSNMTQALEALIRTPYGCFEVYSFLVVVVMIFYSHDS
jgi:uncharacterized protein YfaS (alpha-2-macroglobulin family)